MAPPVVCFGAAHVDRRARAIGAVALATSNPVTVTRGAGGVARNVAETLARLGRSVALVSRVGDDPDGAQVTADLARLGVDVAGVGRSPRRPTASYTALIDPAGELVVALADMAIYDELTADALRPALDRLAGHTVWFLDANLPAGAIAFLLRARPAGATVAVDAVSVAKAARLAGLLDGIDLLFCNRDEAAALSGMAVATPADAAAAADALRRRGARAVVVGCGDAGAHLAADGVAALLPACAGRVADVTGAGDALVAGTLYGYGLDRPIADCVRLGVAAASLTVESDAAVSPALDPDTLLTRARA